MVTFASFTASMPGYLFSGESQAVVEAAITQATNETSTEAGDNFDRIVELKAAIRLWPAGREGIDVWRAELAWLVRVTFCGPQVF